MCSVCVDVVVVGGLSTIFNLQVATGYRAVGSLLASELAFSQKIMNEHEKHARTERKEWKAKKKDE